MTTPPPEHPPSQPEESPEAQPPRLVKRGFWTAVLASVIAFGLGLVGLPLGGIVGVTAPALVLALIVYLIMQSNKRPGTGFGTGAVLGCATTLIVAGGVCIAILASLNV